MKQRKTEQLGNEGPHKDTQSFTPPKKSRFFSTDKRPVQGSTIAARTRQLYGVELKRLSRKLEDPNLSADEERRTSSRIEELQWKQKPGYKPSRPLGGSGGAFSTVVGLARSVGRKISFRKKGEEAPSKLVSATANSSRARGNSESKELSRTSTTRIRSSSTIESPRSSVKRKHKSHDNLLGDDGEHQLGASNKDLEKLAARRADYEAMLIARPEHEKYPAWKRNVIIKRRLREWDKDNA